MRAATVVTTVRARPLVPRTTASAAAAASAATHRRGRHARDGLLLPRLEQAAVVLELLELRLELGEEHLGGGGGGGGGSGMGGGQGGYGKAGEGTRGEEMGGEGPRGGVQARKQE